MVTVSHMSRLSSMDILAHSSLLPLLLTPLLRWMLADSYFLFYPRKEVTCNLHGKLSE